jgi:hypothetical protein
VAPRTCAIHEIALMISLDSLVNLQLVLGLGAHAYDSIYCASIHSASKGRRSWVCARQQHRL